MIVTASAVLLVAGAVTSLTLEAAAGTGARRRGPVAPRRSRPARARALTSPVNPPVSDKGLRAARLVAERFVVSYLRFAYGRASAAWVNAVTGELHGELNRGRAQATPAERSHHPLLVALTTLRTTPGFVVATATVEDGGIASYRLRFTLQEPTGRWLVSSVQEG